MFHRYSWGLGGNHLLFVPSEQAALHIFIVPGISVYPGFFGFFPAKIELVVNVYYFIIPQNSLYLSVGAYSPQMFAFSM